MAKCDIEKLKVGDILYEVTYYVVEGKSEDTVNVKSSDGTDMSISNDIVTRGIFTTNQYEKEIKVTRTQLAQKIETLGHAAFRVTFQKQVTSNEVADGISGQDMGSQAKRRKVVKTLMEGEKRVMHARLYRTSEFDASMELGRYKVIDLEHFWRTENESASIRMVDTRTVSEIVVDNTRYFV